MAYPAYIRAKARELRTERRLTIDQIAGDLARLVDLERSCCPWMSFDFIQPEVVAITAEGEGAAVLAWMFLQPRHAV